MNDLFQISIHKSYELILRGELCLSAYVHQEKGEKWKTK